MKIEQSYCDYIDTYLSDFGKNRFFKEYKSPNCSIIAKKYIIALRKLILSFKSQKGNDATNIFEIGNIKVRDRALL